LGRLSDMSSIRHLFVRQIEELGVTRVEEAKFPVIRTGIVEVPILALDSAIFITCAFWGLSDILPLIIEQIVTR